MLHRRPGRKTVEQQALDRALRALGYAGLPQYLRSRAENCIPYRIVRDDLEKLTGVRVSETSILNWTRAAIRESLPSSHSSEMEAVA